MTSVRSIGAWKCTTTYLEEHFSGNCPWILLHECELPVSWFEIDMSLFRQVVSDD
jgi:hypothetical protein